MPRPLADKVALVTGGSRGIGAAICRRLAADGARVIVHYANSRDKAEAVARDVGGTAVAADLRQPDGGQTLAEAVDRPVDLLVNNAGVFEAAPVTEATDAQFEDVLNVNVRAVFYLTRALARTMPDGGRIVTIGSVGGKAALFSGNALYSMSKFAVRGLSRGFARDLAARQITSNVVQPGPIDTDMNPADADSAADQHARTPLARHGKPAEVAALVAWLCGPEAAFVTGAEYDIAGGWGC